MKIRHVEHRTAVIIDTKALMHNVRKVKKFAPHARIIAMVKANAYGHGVKTVTQAIMSEVDAFGVACLREALELRALMPNKPILLMGGIFSPKEWKTILANHLDIVLHQKWQVESLLSLKLKQKITAWIKIDTGMHRLGVSFKEVLPLYQQLAASAFIENNLGLMTHFACADEKNNPMTQQQIENFEMVLAAIEAQVNHTKTKHMRISLANSAAIMAWPMSYAYPQYTNYVRPGIMLYGISPFLEKTGLDLSLKPVMTFASHIMAIKDCLQGESVGYGATWRSDTARRIAIVAAGYGDGYPRHITQEAVVWVENAYFPIIGRVSMDMLAIDISQKPDIQIGTAVELWGKHLSVERVAQFSGTSPYELVTQVSRRASQEM